MLPQQLPEAVGHSRAREATVPAGTIGRKRQQTPRWWPACRTRPAGGASWCSVTAASGPHALARAVFRGQKNERRQRYRKGREDPPGALSPVTHVLVRWNTHQVAQVLEQWQKTQAAPGPDKVARRPPWLRAHGDRAGCYDCTLPGYTISQLFFLPRYRFSTG